MSKTGSSDQEKRMLGLFLDEFMRLEYNGREHIVAREHYQKIFARLILNYFLPRRSVLRDGGEDPGSNT